MARDCVALMHALGHNHFAVVGHDRGCYVAFRLAMDHPGTATGLVVIDGVPIGEALRRADAKFATAWWHWFFLGQTAKPAEPMISANPDAWYRINPEHMGPEAYADLHRALHNPDTVHAMCEDYRAGLGIDRDHDDADARSGHRVRCPALVIWAMQDDLEELYGDPVSVWRDWLADIRGGVRIDSGHHIAEEAPTELATVINAFLASRLSRSDGRVSQHAFGGTRATS
jgi:haloacetate dehalogenase